MKTIPLFFAVLLLSSCSSVTNQIETITINNTTDTPASPVMSITQTGTTDKQTDVEALRGVARDATANLGLND